MHFFLYKLIHKITFSATVRGANSVLGYLIYSRDNRRYSTDLKVIKGEEIGNNYIILATDTGAKQGKVKPKVQKIEVKKCCKKKL